VNISKSHDSQKRGSERLEEFGIKTTGTTAWKFY
jgi:hypothetical protein